MNLNLKSERIKEILEQKLSLEESNSQWLSSRVDELEKENQQLKEDAEIGRMIKWAIENQIEFVSLGYIFEFATEIINDDDLKRLRKIYEEEKEVEHDSED